MSQNTTDETQLITIRLTPTQVQRLADLCNTAATSPHITPLVAQRARRLAAAFQARAIAALAQRHLELANEQLTGPPAEGAS